LKENAGYVSGEELSEQLGVSRTAVWKHIQELRKKGYVIESRSKRGYRLLKSTDRLDGSEISRHLKTVELGRVLRLFDTLDSTNAEGKRVSATRFENGTVILSEEQTLGKGRLGRVWVSPAGKGLWMSVLMRPTDLEPKDGSKLTIVAAAAVASAVEKVTKLQVGIKWPNDIVRNGKKVCGILTEMGAEMDAISWLILGIGINVNLEKEDFPEELKNTGTSLRIELGEEQAESIDRNLLCAEILNELERFGRLFFETGRLTEVLDYYRERVLVKDRELLVHTRGGSFHRIGVGISEEGHLLVRTEDGKTEEYMSGEVSVRGLYGYV